MFVAGSIIAFYFVSFFSDSYTAGIIIDNSAVIIATIAFILAVILYLWTPKKFITLSSLSIYVFLVALSATLILTSGELQSPFIALWILVAIFAGIFGVYGIIPLFIASNYFIITGLINNTLDSNTIIMSVLAGWLPVIAGYIVWHGRTVHEEGKDRAFRDLASELSEVASKSEVVINAIADGVIAVDNQGIIQLINPAAQQITGWGKQDATTLSYKSVLKLSDTQNKDLIDANDPVVSVLATNKEVTRNDLSLTTHSGKKLLVSVIVSPVGQLGAGAIIVFRDITKDKAEEREQAEFISTASHEMRTPVASIEGYLGLALNPATAQIDEKARDFITKAHESAQHLGRLFQDLLDVSKADDGRLSNNPSIVDVVVFAGTIVEGLRPQADAKKLRLVYKPLSDDANDNRRLNPVFYALVDNDHLREVIANLTENAIKYTLQGDVIIDVQGDDEHITLSIADSGIGIPAEDIPHLFQKFYRVDNTDTREIGGTGLGLYLCRRLSEVMGGRIWVESTYKKGSTFHLELPRTSHEDATRLIEAASVKQEAATPAIQPIPTTAPILPVQPEVITQPTQPTVHQPDAASTITSPPAQLVAQQLQSIQQPRPVAPQNVNVPLTTLEQNPNQYIQSRPQGVVIPKRQDRP
jgi:PAS domain S-box-containing protein